MIRGCQQRIVGHSRVPSVSAIDDRVEPSPNTCAASGKAWSCSCSGSSKPVLQFHRYQAGNGDSEEELADDGLEIGQAAGQWIDRNDVAVTRRGQRGKTEI